MWTNASSYVAGLTQALQRLDLHAVDRLAQAVHLAYLRRRTVFFIGNGGSASTASHLAAAFSKLTTRQARLRCMALVDSVAALTAAGNDFAYEDVFVEQLRTFLEPGDVVVGISTSGRSRNVVRACRTAREHGLATIGMTGRGGPLADGADLAFTVASDVTARIQEAHLTLAHILCELVERALFPEGVLP